MTPLRVGVLGAARIVPSALVNPAKQVPEAQIVAVAARDKARAEEFAKKQGIPRVLGSYAELIADPGIDAIYNPLPNSLHCEWTVRALDAGKHVLCEKPIASNTAEAEKMRDAASRNKRVLMEAFHWRYHPLAAKGIDIVRGGKLGKIKRVEAAMCFPLLSPGDIRYRYDLSGGAMMDAGCYAVSMVRHVSGEEPEVLSAKYKLSSPNVDRLMVAELKFPSGATGKVSASMFSAKVLDLSFTVIGEAGELHVTNPVLPSWWNRLTVKTPSGTTAERVAGDATYVYQLRAFVRAVESGELLPTGPNDAVLNMRVIDAVYSKAGLPLRGKP